MFKLHSPFHPTGDQPQAIEKLMRGLNHGARDQVLLGVTGSGKTFTVANVIAQMNRPTLVISHNKTLAAQLYQEYRDFFPENAVGYFVSYYDYYQPEAYIPQTDTYIEKETDVNDLIDKLRLQATTNLLTRKDVIIVASVSAIYNLGAPSEYERSIVTLSPGLRIDRRTLMVRLTDLQYRRSETEFARGVFRVRGNMIDIWPAYEDKALRIILEGDVVNELSWIDPISSERITNNESRITRAVIYPAKHYLTNPSQYDDVFDHIRKDLQRQVKVFENAGKIVEAHRIRQRVEHDLEMLQELGYVNGIENYSRYFDGRTIGEPPHTLLAYFSRCDPNFLTIIDESHISIPQLRGMYRGDRSRKEVLIDYGFRLPAARDNRPLTFEEFRERTGQTIYTSATPDDFEIELAKHSVISSPLSVIGPLSASRRSVGFGQADRKLENRKPTTDNRKPITDGVVQQLIRPTGLIDPEVEIRSAEHQVQDLVIEILKRKKLGERVLVTTLTKKTAEALTEYLQNPKKIETIINQYQKEFHQSPITSHQSLCVSYLHADVHTLDRQDTLDNLRKGDIDVIVGINLLREGLDLPEVSLVAILDADQEGFLRSKTSLIQTMGRAARHINGKVILYAYKVTGSMEAAIAEVNRRRAIQIQYNLDHNLMPTGIVKPIREKLIDRPPDDLKTRVELPNTIAKRYRVEKMDDLDTDSLTPTDRKTLIRHLTKHMFAAADELDFEKAARVRDTMLELKKT